MTGHLPTIIFKITRAADWTIADASGEFAGSRDDLRDGYIHLSTATQVRETAARHFAGQSGLVLVAIDTASLHGVLKWEASRGGALFPHLYGCLAMTSVVWARPLPLGPDQRHIFPTEFA